MGDGFCNFPEASVSQNIIPMLVYEKLNALVEYRLDVLLFLGCKIKRGQNAL